VFKPAINLLARSAAFAAIFLFTSAPAVAGNAPADKAAAEAKARDYFSNVELVDQNGQRLKFYDEVLKDNIVVISFIFTNCARTNAATSSSSRSASTRCAIRRPR
jgi:cytochrome oxidase Cu insertion factor (SCO1/SenC/PrrC family)